MGTRGALSIRPLVSAARLVVWLVWLGLTGLAFVTLVHTARNIPVAEDWRLVGPVTGHEPDLGEWLWGTGEAEQPAPLPRLVGLGAVAVARDFRAPALLGLLALSAAAAAILLGIAELRSGRTRYTDAAVPLLVLQPALWIGRSGILLLQAAIPLGLFVTLLLGVTMDPALRTRRWGLLAAVALLLLPFSGLAGFALALGVAPWIAACGWRHWPPRDPQVPRNAGPALLMMVLIMLLLAGVYVGHSDLTAWFNAHSSIDGVVREAAAGLVLAGGPAAVLQPRLAALAVIFLLLIGSGTLVAVVRRRLGETERLRAGGMLCLLIGLALSAGIGEPNWGIAVGALCAVLFAWELYGPPVATVLLETVTLAALVAFAPGNVRIARARRDQYVAAIGRVVGDIQARVTAPELARRERSFLLPWTTVTELASGIEMVRRAGLGELTALAPAGSGSATPRR